MSKWNRWILAGLFVFTGGGISHATHTIGLNASNLITGTLPNSRIDCSSISCLGPTIEGSEISDGSITGSKLDQSVIARSYDLVIGTAGVTGANFTGNDRTPFVQANSSAALVGGRRDIFVRAGTYTITTVGLENVRLICENGVVFRRQSPTAPMFRLKNSEWEGGQIISTAVAGTLVSTAAIGLEGTVKIRRMKIDAQTTQNFNDILMSTVSFIYGSSVNVVLDGLDVATFTALGNTCKFAIFDLSTVTIRNCNIKTEMAATANSQMFYLRHSISQVLDNVLDNRSGPEISILDNGTVNQPSKYLIARNRLIDSFGGAGGLYAPIYDNSNSSGSIIQNNECIAETGAAGCIHIGQGGANSLQYAPANLIISGNQMYSSNNTLRSTAIFITLRTDSKAIQDIFLVGNSASNINTFLREQGTVVNTGMRSNRLNAASVADQN